MFNRKILIVSGDDAESFLQQILTNDIRKIEKNTLQYNLILSPQGKLLHDLFISKQSLNEFYLDCYGEAVNEIHDLLQRYRLGSKVLFHIESSLQVYLSNLNGYSDPRSDRLYNRFYTANNAESINENPEIYYDLLLPRLYIDFDSGEYFPFEVNFDKFHCISHSKGCYIGQEVITRTAFRGVVRKKIYQVQASNGKGYELFIQHRKIGKILNIYSENKGLALINSALVENTDFVELSSGDKVQILTR